MLDFNYVNVLIIGDVMLDEYINGNAERLSPEAPIPVIHVSNTSYSPGGAANVAANIAALGAKCTLVSIPGFDNAAHILSEMLNRPGITSWLDPCIDRVTTRKVRIMSGATQIARVDYEDPTPINNKAEGEIITTILKIMPEYNAVILSDYNKGVCTPRICTEIIKKACEIQIPVIVDPKGPDWGKYRGASVITPNVKELGDAMGCIIHNDNVEIDGACDLLAKTYDIKTIITTRAEKGVSIHEGGETRHYSTSCQVICDVSGAGDTALSVIALCKVVGMDNDSIARIANMAGGIAVRKPKTVPVSIGELRDELYKGVKIVKLPELKTLCSGKSVVFTNGCFDILHRGHIDFLKAAKAHGDVLIVGVNSDASVRKLKGDERPINNERDRTETLAALSCVDYVIMFDEDTPKDLIKEIRPAVLAKGGDYEINNIAGKEYAGCVRIVPYISGYSTTEIIRKIKNEP